MRWFALTMATGALCCGTVHAAPVDEHVRGQIVSVEPHTLVVRTAEGREVSFTLNDATHYLQVVPTSLDKVEPGSYIGTATKDTGSTQVAIEVMIFPAELRGINPGHFPYDRLPDTTLSGSTTTSSKMTNGSVAAVKVPAGGNVGTMMTNGDVSTTTSENGVKQLKVTYKGGEQTVLVPPTAPIVNLNPAKVSDLSEGAYVFVDAMRDGKSQTAGLVAFGAGGLKPPF
jgi:hypothetical protein